MDRLYGDDALLSHQRNGAANTLRVKRSCRRRDARIAPQMRTMYIAVKATEAISWMVAYRA